MILFESFTYDQEWAEKNYKPTIKDTYWYLEGIINHDQEFLNSLPNVDEKERFWFNIRRIDLKMDQMNNVFEVSVFSHPNWLIKEDQKQYIKRRLMAKIPEAVDFRIDTVIKSLVPEEASHRMFFQYFIEKDENRYNVNHDRVNIENSIVDKFCNMCTEPGIEVWLEMLDLFYSKKNERLIFKKLKTFEEFSQKLIVAIKLNWTKATWIIKQHIYNFVDSEEKKIHYNYTDFAVEGIYKFAKEYEVPEEIQDIVNSYSVNTKCKGQAPSLKCKKFAHVLDNNMKVQSYSFTIPKDRSSYSPLFVINVTLTNGNTGWISVRHYNGLYRMDLYLDKDVDRTINRVGETIYENWLEDRKDGKGIISYVDEVIEKLYKLEIKKED